MFEVVQSSTTTVVEVYPEAHDAAVPTAATVKAYSPSGELLETVVASVDSASATVSSASSDQQSLTLSDGTGIVVGRAYRVELSSGAIAIVRAERVSGSVMTIADPTGFDPTGATVKGLRVYATLTAATTEDRGVNHSLIWEVVQGVETRIYSDVYHVVRMQFRDPVTPSDVYSFVASHHPSSAAAMTMEQRKRIADRANVRVRSRLLETQRYPHLVGDPAIFSEAGRASLEWVLLSERMLMPSTDDDLTTVMTSLDRRVAEEVTRGITNCWYDASDERVVDRDEVAPISTRIEL